MFRPYFIKPKTTVITRCIIIPHARKRVSLSDTCKTARTSEVFKWKGNLSESMKERNSEKIRNSLDVHPSRKWLHEGTIYSHNEILTAVKSHRSRKYRGVKIARRGVTDSSHLWPHTHPRNLIKVLETTFCYIWTPIKSWFPWMSILSVGWTLPFGFANCSVQSSKEVELNQINVYATAGSFSQPAARAT